MSWTTLQFNYLSLLTAIKLGQLQNNIGLKRGPGNQQFFTSNGTYTKTPGIKSIKVTVIGGGGGGGNGQESTNDFSCSGCGGGCAIKWIDAAVIGSTEIVTIGQGGTAGTGNGGASGIGTDGGTSSFGSHCYATGGQGGGPEVYRALGGKGTNGAINLRGQSTFGYYGHPDFSGEPGDIGYELAGGSPGGLVAGSIAFLAADSYGAGGWGGMYNQYVPGNGASGVVIIEEYF